MYGVKNKVGHLWICYVVVWSDLVYDEIWGQLKKSTPPPLFPLRWSERYWRSSSVKVKGTICLRSDWSRTTVPLRPSEGVDCRSTKIDSEIFDDIRNAKDHRHKQSDPIVKEELQKLDDQIKALMEVGVTHYVTIQGNKQRNWRCKVCGKEANKTHKIGHIEVHHITSNVVHSFDICGKVSRSRDGLRKHKSRDGCRDHKAAFTASC